MGGGSAVGGVGASNKPRVILRRLPQRLHRGAAPSRAVRRRVPRDPPRQRRHRRGSPQSPERHARPSRPQKRSPLPDPAPPARRARTPRRPRRRQAPGPACRGRPRGEVRLAWRAKETLRGLATSTARPSRGLPRRSRRRRLPAGAAPPGPHPGALAHRHREPHRSRVTNGPTEAINKLIKRVLIKRVKRAAFGFRRFAHYRIRALLYAGKPSWALLAAITPR